MAFFPREHGAYGQLLFPLITALGVAGVSPAALLVALAAVAGFVAHEPLLVLAGGRGVRAVRERRAPAVRWLAIWGALACVAGIAAFWMVPARIRWSFLLPLVPATLLALTFFTKSEKTARGEVAAALAFALLATPVCLASGAPARDALGVGLAFAAVFVSATLSVRVIVLNVRGGGQPGAVRAMQRLVLVVSAVTVAALGWAAAGGLLPWVTLVAAAPGLAVGGVLVVAIPPPARLRAVGWTLVAASAAAALILIAGLRLLP
ncbi:MAG: YwiC-like family protein [Acidobacteria bacterium]|nr:YwiC-like family protein [Acidobacteriota bacterium]